MFSTLSIPEEKKNKKGPGYEYSTPLTFLCLYRDFKVQFTFYISHVTSRSCASGMCGQGSIQFFFLVSVLALICWHASAI